MIDWFTVCAQIVNFLILVYLLKRFLYGPIIAAIDKREEKISARIKEVEQKHLAAEEEINLYRKKNEDFERQRAEMSAQMKEETGVQKNELLEKARQEIDDIKTRWNESVMRERDVFLRDLRRRVIDQVYAITREALADLAATDIEQHIVNVLIKKIKEANGEKVTQTLRNSPTGITIATSFELPGEQRQTISEAVREFLVENRDVKFIVSKDIICGIELKGNGYVIGWNLEGYLNSLEEDFNVAIEAGTGRAKC
ncbi:MAG: F0F1 ATP synthase subunit B [Candidatus Scalindua sp. AMX11]|nr:MAG: F0F1 ATP synthase subunit B [Candidatus Scalindua sp.]NOG84695.1 F0F1 ATP synthase subunit B [Planctomycetota bacterium]RZV98308.1 MAG: F0F1 ATP synthase subunit B [Candidatus Scalindua sp. SCAELEC01]TDE66600.1 MAG: F0F1 ATP synthase subunit B [Candidatus Scalindua sp. AMX11]GJQ58975.1 MAG: ATP synthase subunit B [Candidatus Scalindua sp.]